MKKAIISILIITSFIITHGCSKPNFTPVDNFDAERYMGLWYEIARMPNRFEEGMIDVTAFYKQNDKGRVKVINSGIRDGERKSAEAVAKPAGDPALGHLRVSFFRPFYAHYIIVDLDRENYSWALVASSEKYLWILAREAVLDQGITEKLVSQAKELGFDIEQLYFTPHGEK